MTTRKRIADHAVQMLAAANRLSITSGDDLLTEIGVRAGIRRPCRWRLHAAVLQALDADPRRFERRLTNGQDARGHYRPLRQYWLRDPLKARSQALLWEMQDAQTGALSLQDPTEATRIGRAIAAYLRQ